MLQNPTRARSQKLSIAYLKIFLEQLKLPAYYDRGNAHTVPFHAGFRPYFTAVILDRSQINVGHLSWPPVIIFFIFFVNDLPAPNVISDTEHLWVRLFNTRIHRLKMSQNLSLFRGYCMESREVVLLRMLGINSEGIFLIEKVTCRGILRNERILLTNSFF